MDIKKILLGLTLCLFIPLGAKGSEQSPFTNVLPPPPPASSAPQPKALPNANAPITIIGPSGGTNDFLDIFPSGLNPLYFGITAAGYTETLQPSTPGGRLTLTSGTPVMAADATAQTTVFYTPYVKAVIPIYNGTVWTLFPFAQLSLILNTSTHLSGNIYDIYVYSNNGVISIGTSPAWTTTTARQAAVALTQINGIWTNNLAITVTNNATTFALGANKGTYVGSMYATANGQTTMNFAPVAVSGGSNNFLALYNAYNRVRYTTTELHSDNPAYSSATWRAVGGSNSNRVTFLDGLQQSFIKGTARGLLTMVVSSNTSESINLDSTSATPALFSLSRVGSNSGAGPTYVFSLVPGPQLGLHFLTLMEAGDGANSNTNNGTPFSDFIVEFDD